METDIDYICSSEWFLYGVKPNPTAIIRYFDRLADNYGLEQYRQSKQKAVEWIMENPVKTFNWQAQFEDSNPAPPYHNLSREQACDFAVYIFKYFRNDPQKIELAAELIRYAEDQFVIWEKPLEYGSMKNKSHSSFWITPSPFTTEDRRKQGRPIASDAR